jgi:16S rRNA (guanine527-N7)-methyltransferase
MTVPRETFESAALPERAVEDLSRYAALLRRWSSRINLVAPRDLDDLESRHIADCLRLLPLARSLPAGPAIDVGSGAGFPGVVLAVVERDRRWCLLERHRRRAAFLEEVVRALDLDAGVVPLTAEAAADRPELRGMHVLATARALAPPATAFRLLEPLGHPAGVRVVMVGRRGAIPTQAEEWTDGVAIIRGNTEARMGENGNI